MYLTKMSEGLNQEAGGGGTDPQMGAEVSWGVQLGSSSWGSSRRATGLCEIALCEAEPNNTDLFAF